MLYLGYDAGTYNGVCARRDANQDFAYKREINAFIEIPLENRFTFNMMKSAGIPLIERDNVAYALGEAAVNMAYTLPTLELKRPMKDGCVNPQERDAFQIMSVMMHSLIDPVEKETLLYYCIPADAVNKETDADYHQKIVQAIFDNFESDEGYKIISRPINEALALVYAELATKAFTGIGISCLCPGTKIYSSDGIVNIEDVKIGDYVITHKGRNRQVTNVITKNFKGVATKIQMQGYSNDTKEYKFVDNHELYVKREGEWKWVGCEDLVVGDVVGEPIVSSNSNSKKIGINICEKITSSPTINKKRYESTPSLQRLFGYFLGDGSVNESEGCIQFDFAKHEMSNIKDVKEIILRVFDKNVAETEKGENCIRLKCYSRGLCNYFMNNFYDKNKVKLYPWDISRLNNNDCLNLLVGMIRSDGTNHKDSVVFSNTNTRLISLAKQLFSRLGYAASISYREPRTHTLEDGRVIAGKLQEWSVCAAGKKTENSLVDYIDNLNTENDRQSQKMFIEDGFCCTTIQKIEYEDYEGVVYDLQVDEDHSFSGPFLTIHNCGAGMVNVCYAMYGNPIFKFAIVNSGDWIDKQAAKAIGESPTFVNKQKMKVSLLKEPTTLVERAIQTQYNLMIERTVKGIMDGFANANKTVRSDTPVDIVVAGGTSLIHGFRDVFDKAIRQVELPITIGEVIQPADALYSVARGCLIAAEAAGK